VIAPCLSFLTPFRLASPRDHDILVPLIDGYENDGTFTPEFADEARKRARAEHDGKRLGKIILRCLGVV
jgi:hypothetical protein